MITALEMNKLSAVSCAEQPRPDSDLFYRFFIHTQYEAEGLNLDRILSWDQSCSSYMGLRSNAQLSDIATLIRHDVFKQYRYRALYAEDLELGLRLIRDGYKLGFLNSVRVLHSHNRPAYHFLKRAYADVRFLANVFPNFVYPEISNVDRLYAEIAFLHGSLCNLAQTTGGMRFPVPVPELLKQVRAGLTRIEHMPVTKCLDAELEEFVRQLPVSPHFCCGHLEVNRSMLLPHVRAHFDRFCAWVSGSHDMADQTLATEIIAAAEKISALHYGTHLAYLFLTSQVSGRASERIISTDKVLTTGV
jgi:hypothetical protein